jgi:hypothetical protein
MYTSIEQSPSNVVLKQLFIPLKKKVSEKPSCSSKKKREREEEEGKDERS